MSMKLSANHQRATEAPKGSRLRRRNAARRTHSGLPSGCSNWHLGQSIGAAMVQLSRENSKSALTQELPAVRNLLLNVRRIVCRKVTEAMKMSGRSYIPLRVPAVLLHVSDERCTDMASSLLGDPPGLHQLGPHLLAVLPIPGDPGDVEEAVRIADRLRRQGPAGLTIIVVPGQVCIVPGGTAPGPEPLLDDLERRRPASLASGQVHLTGRAASRLESRWSVERSGTCEIAAGSLIPLFQLSGPRPDGVPWHTSRLLGRTLDYVKRPAVEQELVAHAEAPVLRVSGPVRLVFDDLQTASPTDLQLLEALTSDPRARSNARVVLVGRKRTRGPATWSGVPEVTVPLLTAAESTGLATGLFHGLLMPTEVQQRLVETAGRCPFALEEGLARMIQQRRVRRHYGNFFYSGSPAADLGPSFRP